RLAPIALAARTWDCGCMSQVATHKPPFLSPRASQEGALAPTPWLPPHTVPRGGLGKQTRCVRGLNGDGRFFSGPLPDTRVVSKMHGQDSGVKEFRVVLQELWREAISDSGLDASKLQHFDAVRVVRGGAGGQWWAPGTSVLEPPVEL